MTNKLVVIINSFKVPKIKKVLLYEMKFLVLNYSCLQNPWLGGYAPRSLFSLSSVLNWICWTPPAKNSWVRHWPQPQPIQTWVVLFLEIRAAACLQIPPQLHAQISHLPVKMWRNYGNRSAAVLSVCDLFTSRSVGRDSDWLRAGRSADRISVGAKFYASAQTGPVAHPASCIMGTVSLPRKKNGRGVALTTYPIYRRS